MTQKKKQKTPQKSNFFVQMLWLTVLGGVLIAAGTFLYISKKLLPDTEELENPKYKIASSILASDGSELGKPACKGRSVCCSGCGKPAS